MTDATTAQGYLKPHQRWLLKSCLRTKSHSLTVLAYHRVLSEYDPMRDYEIDHNKFRIQLDTMLKLCRPVVLSEAVAALRHNQLKGHCFAVTFDDGYRDNLSVAAPLLMQMGVPATLFSTTAYMDGGLMWNDRVIEACRAASSEVHDLQMIGGETFNATDISQRRQGMYRLLRWLKYMPPQLREEKIAALESLWGETSSSLMLNRDEMRQLLQRGFEIGGHTVRHPILAKLDDVEAEKEIRENHQHLHSIIGKAPSLFAYPNGKPGLDFYQHHCHMVQNAGYSAAFTTSIGSVSHRNHPMQLPRLGLWQSSGIACGMELIRNLYRRAEQAEI